MVSDRALYDALFRPVHNILGNAVFPATCPQAPVLAAVQAYLTRSLPMWGIELVEVDGGLQATIATYVRVPSKPPSIVQ